MQMTAIRCVSQYGKTKRMEQFRIGLQASPWMRMRQRVVAGPRQEDATLCREQGGRHRRYGQAEIALDDASRGAGRLLSVSLFSLCLGFLGAGCQSTANNAAGPVAEPVKTGVAGLFGRNSPLPQTIAIRFDASMDSNADENGNGLATVMRVYHLRNTVAFLSLPPAAFLDAERERAMLGNSLIETREFTLVPGQSIDSAEPVALGASHLGIVTLFRKRSGQRWRLAFASAEAARAGIVIGVHACAMTATRTTPLGMSAQDALLLSPAPCR